MKFIDEAEITVWAGRGGNGAVSFNRQRYAPKGGPDGGKGGHGGSVIFRATSQLATLQDITLNRVYKAGNGKPGEGSRKSGRSAKNLIIELPVGTVIWNCADNSIMADLAEDGEQFIAAEGGRGGRGNKAFATSRNQSPRRAESGFPGQEFRVRLELKLIADVGLVGRPNVGKSTLLAALTKANPVIGDYPFSTLHPALGVIQVGLYQRIVMADIPGLAEGAHTGRGLGHRFLRHIERTRLLLLMIESTEDDYERSIEELLNELIQFNPMMAKLPRMVVLSKSDLLNDHIDTDLFDCTISSVTGQGLDELIKLLADRLGMTIV